MIAQVLEVVLDRERYENSLAVLDSYGRLYFGRLTSILGRLLTFFFRSFRLLCLCIILLLSFTRSLFRYS